MKMLIVYQDELWCNPIIHASVIYDDNELTEKVERIVKDNGIGMEADDIVWNLLGISGHCWADEAYCFSIVNVNDK